MQSKYSRALICDIIAEICVFQHAEDIYMSIFDTRHYVVEKIDGDYAHLRRTDEAEEELMLVARALLPESIDEGTRLVYEMLQYEIEE